MRTRPHTASVYLYQMCAVPNRGAFSKAVMQDPDCETQQRTQNCLRLKSKVSRSVAPSLISLRTDGRVREEESKKHKVPSGWGSRVFHCPDVPESESPQRLNQI